MDALLSERIRATSVVSSPSELEDIFAAGAPDAAVIGTHSGNFHADEALACGMLKLLPEYAAAPVVRSRDAAAWARSSVLVDVGAVYDAAAHRYDHHQASFIDTYDGAHTVTKLSSAGLVYKHFGDRLVAAIVGAEVDAATLAKLVLRTYDHFVQELDAIDNGVEAAEGAVRYRVSTGLSSRVGKLNPAWNEDSSPAAQNARFREAMLLTAGEFVDCVLGYKNAWLPARSIVKAAVEAAATVHPSGAIAVLEQFCPWKDHLFELEAEGAAAAGKTLYVVFADTSGSWRVQAVPRDAESFATRKPLPATWGGLRDAELSAAAAIPGCIFVHAGRFIAGNATREGALQMAAAAVAAAS